MVLTMACGSSDAPEDRSSFDRATTRPTAQSNIATAALAPGVDQATAQPTPETPTPRPMSTSTPATTPLVVPATPSTSGPTPDVEITNTSIEAEREALVALYNATDGPRWRTDVDHWLSDAPLGEWVGVITNREGHVLRLELSQSSLSGELPKELGNLANLRVLNLGVNQLSGELPKELGNLSNLQVLDLRENQLTGEIPPWLGNLANLQELDLSSDQLSGKLPKELGNLANLEWLDLNNNQLSGRIPGSWRTSPTWDG